VPHPLTRLPAPGLTLHALLTRLPDATPAPGDADPLVTGVTLDSRSVQPGDLYAALPGFNAHGADYAAQAVRQGAVAVLTDPSGRDRLGDEVTDAVPVVVVDAPREALGGLAAEVYGRAGEALTMLGITGTNGKTTTAYLVESALRALGRRTGLIGTVETRVGDDRLDSERTTPEATDLHALLALMRERGVDACVMEVSSHALELHRVDGVVYDVALFTNLSQDHLDFHPDMEAYFRAKASLFTPERSHAGVVCVDDAWGARLAAEATVPVTTLATGVVTRPDGDVGGDGGGLGQDADWVVLPSPEEESRPGAFVLHRPATGERMHLVSHLAGTFNVANTALAALALASCGVGLDDAAAAMAVPPDVPGRMQLVAAADEHTPGSPRCIVDFAHTPDAVDAALEALRPSTPGRLVVVLGAGGDRDRGKRPAMGAAAARRADVVVVTDDNPRSEAPESIREALLAGARATVDEQRASGAPVAQLVDGGARSAAIAQAVELATTAARTSGLASTVAVLGKGHEKGQQVGAVTHPFDDRDAVLAALLAAAGESARAGRTS
jgi:UDP-N-acetylmuramoyl-L-alanyl-D-glutamate--2,6-diaminopimelate ligase